MYYAVEGCDKCCKECGKLFSSPFSLCTFLAIFPGVGSFILMIIAVIQGSSNFDTCEKPV